jgi:hypothetical protein
MRRRAGDLEPVSQTALIFENLRGDKDTSTATGRDID